MLDSVSVRATNKSMANCGYSLMLCERMCCSNGCRRKGDKPLHCEKHGDHIHIDRASSLRYY